MGGSILPPSIAGGSSTILATDACSYHATYPQLNYTPKLCISRSLAYNLTGKSLLLSKPLFIRTTSAGSGSIISTRGK